MQRLMLKSTFQHLKGIGKKSEKALWEKGLTTWERYAASFPKQYCLFGPPISDCPLEASMAAYEQGDMDFFAKALPTAEYYRVALEFPQDVLFLDIETTGLSLHYDIITIVGWSIGKNYGVYINGQSDDLLRTSLAQAKAIVTFNGIMFDLKFMAKHFNSFRMPPIHIDLRFFARRVGLSGGQKNIEREIGYKRRARIVDMHGEAAPILWHKYRRGSLHAMRKLIEYNHADIEGMKYILDACIERFYEKESVPREVQKKPNFVKQRSQIIWSAKDKKIHPSYAIFVPEFSGSAKPLITYEELNAIHPLANFCAIGIDLVSSEAKESGFCILKGCRAATSRVKTDDEMIRLAVEAKANIISIDSPLSVPKGRTSFFDDDPHRDEFGITRECERILKKRGISSYPCLIQCMQKLTQRGMLLAQKFRNLGIPVIESYPGAAQDIMSIPRKQAGIDYLVQGLKEFGVTGEFTRSHVSHDELDAITSAIVGHFFWVGMYEGLGNPDEEYLIIPDLNANYRNWLSCRIIGLSGPHAASKTAVVEHLKKHGYAHKSYCEFVRDDMKTTDSTRSRSAIHGLGGVQRRQIGKQIVDSVAGEKRVIVSGLTFLEDHALMVESYGPSFVHLHIAASLENRRERFLLTRQDDARPGATDVHHQCEEEAAQMKEIAHCTITNDESVEDLLRKIDGHI